VETLLQLNGLQWNDEESKPATAYTQLRTLPGREVLPLLSQVAGAFDPALPEEERGAGRQALLHLVPSLEGLEGETQLRYGAQKLMLVKGVEEASKEFRELLERRCEDPGTLSPAFATSCHTR
jgi:hypothetical protein